MAASFGNASENERISCEESENENKERKRKKKLGGKM